ncbi:MAG: lipoate--protein ligase family protein [Pirellulaceae bacterium]|nr:lipoate--protein ligase family protein [Pirellulaceae bacterium]
MQFLDLTLPTPAQNLALDEALLLAAEPDENQRAVAMDCEVLRVWQSAQTCVVVGRSSRVDAEVHRQQAQQSGISILRRPSGGASVVIAPGCLMYSLLLDLRYRPQLRMLDALHRFVMSQMLQALIRVCPEATFQGTCDLTLHNRKFSGNSLRLGRDWALYHGTLLLNMDLAVVDRLLRHPPREPDYRTKRPHSQFITNLGVDGDAVVSALRSQWQADQRLPHPPVELVAKLCAERYYLDAWNFQR